MTDNRSLEQKLEDMQKAGDALVDWVLDIIQDQAILAEELRLDWADAVEGAESQTTNNEIEQLREQVETAHAILGSEWMMWISVGNSENPEKYRDLLEPALTEYWDRYGNNARGPISG